MSVGTTLPLSSSSALIRSFIARNGPVNIAEYMGLCLTHPEFGYYRHQNPFGRKGDFITAPEISQMFGEIIGAWCAHMWTVLGAPSPLRLIELGPGRGTLMDDICRAAAKKKGFLDSCEPHLIETSPILRSLQKEAIQNTKPNKMIWHEEFESVPSGPFIVIANEFFDALPVHQYIRIPSGWRERFVSSNADMLVFSYGDTECTEKIPPLLRTAEIGSVVETSPEREAVMTQIAIRLRNTLGVSLVIDYGYSGPCVGDTLQSVARHRFVDPLAYPGESDLTAHVDFSVLADLAQKAGIQVHGPITQGSFLQELGIDLRAEQLQRAHPCKAEEIRAALARLLAPEHMGTLFQTMAFSSPALPTPPPFPVLN